MTLSAGLVGLCLSVLPFVYGLDMGRAFAQSQLGQQQEVAPSFIIERYRAKAEAGDVGAQFRLGILYERGAVTGSADFLDAAAWFDRAAAGGYGPAQFKRALYFQEGIAGPKDMPAAATLYQKAAEKGLGEAQFNLALMLTQGVGVEKDIPAAIRWYEQAAFRGVIPAMRTLGLLYMGGVSRTPHDAIESWAWFTLAVEAGDTKAAELLPEVTAEMDTAALAEASRLADAYRQLRLRP
ncbi:MAG: tetratricopeptide repeat protein [Alphaproteobacteria bacterium]|nr:tetratricopeptide repeat protein [Alphaproteobacteria bacterium]